MLDPTWSPTRLVAHGERDVPPVQPSDARVSGTARLLAVLIRWMVGICWLRLTRRMTPDARAHRLTRLLEEFGGLWIKAGQMLALRVDLFSPELCQDLSQLQTAGTAVPFAAARRILEEELGPIGDTFDEFEERPFTADWIGQIHRAHLRRERVWVAVKIQRPGVANTFSRDLRVMRWFTHALHRLHVYRSVRWDQGLQELEQIAREESDFRFEAAAIDRMRDNLPRRKMVVPDVFPDYCTRRVLVTEFIHAALMSDFIRLQDADPDRLRVWLAANRIVPRRLAHRLIHSFLRQLFENNFYHGDLHPKNIVLLRDNRLAFLQFGACSITEREYLQKLQLFFRALATRDYAKAADVALLLCGQLPVINTEDVKEELVRGLRAWAARTFVKGLPYKEKSIDNATVIVTHILFKYGCPMDWGFLRVRRALTILDASIVHLEPDINYTKLCADYFSKAERRTLQRSLGRPLAVRAASAVTKALDMQDRLSEYALFQGAIVRRHAQVFQGATHKLSDLTAVLLGHATVIVLVAAAVFAMALVEQRTPGILRSVLGDELSRQIHRIPALGRGPSSLVLVMLFYVAWTFGRLTRRFREKEVRLPNTQTTV